MKTIFTLLVALVSIQTIAQRFDWVSFTPLQYGNDGSGIRSVTHDAEGNLYTVSVFNNPIIVASDTLAHVGNLNRPDILITKWNPEGEVLNYRHIANWSGNGNPDPQGLLYDEESGQILLTISSYYDGMQITLLSNGIEEDSLMSLAHGAVLRFNTDLSFVSQRTIPGGNSYGTAAVVKDGFLYAAQGYNSTISKTDADGTILWSITPTGTTYYITDLVVTNDNFLYVIGYYHSNQTSHNGITLGDEMVMPPSAGNNNHVVIFKLSTDGTVLQGSYLVQAFNYTFPLRIAADNANNILVSATYEIPGLTLGSFTLSATPDGRDVLVTKLNNALQPLWVTEIAAPGDTKAYDILAHPNGKVMVVGDYAGNATIGGFPLDFSQYGTGYMAQMDNTTGDIMYATNFGSLSAGSGNPFSISNIDDTYYIGGACSGNDVVTHWTASFGCHTTSRTRAYLTAFTDTPFETPTVELVYGSVSLLASTNVDGASFQWFLNDEELVGETESSIVPSAIGNYEVVVTYYGCTASDTYTLSCLPTTATDVVSACNTYTWIDGITYTSNNSTATHLLSSSLGCDSLVTLNLTIEQISDVVTVNGNTLTATQDGAEYLWLDCGSKLTVIPNETEQSFTPAQNGSYAVQVISDNCNVISECFDFTLVGVKQDVMNQSISIYPNPANDYIVISGITMNTKLVITDLNGRVVLDTIMNSDKYSVDTSMMNAGVYNLRLESNDNVLCEQIIISK